MDRVVRLACVVVGVLACSGSSSPPPADAGMEAALDAGPGAGDALDVAPEASSFVCGRNRCTPGQICVIPCCSSTLPPCSPVPDGGRCPEGTTPGICPGGIEGCTAGLCVPPGPFCLDVPAACGTSRTCGCYMQDPCARENQGRCTGLTGRMMTCACS